MVPRSLRRGPENREPTVSGLPHLGACLKNPSGFGRRRAASGRRWTFQTSPPAQSLRAVHRQGSMAGPAGDRLDPHAARADLRHHGGPGHPLVGEGAVDRACTALLPGEKPGCRVQPRAARCDHAAGGRHDEAVLHAVPELLSAIEQLLLCRPLVASGDLRGADARGQRPRPSWPRPTRLSTGTY